ncbi:MAG: helix-turn-helix transcriptional regulator [Clostridiales bacterium]|nr:helix-turn-helix transcriptional regulator [Clostridiales bacterium]
METRYENIVVEQQLKYSFRCFRQEYSDHRVMCYAHWHNYIELLYLEEGSVNIFLNGKLYQAHKEDLVIINSKEAHQIETIDKDTRYIVIQFDPDMLHMSSTAFTLKYILPFSGPDKTYPRLFKKEDIYKTEIKLRIQHIYDEMLNEEYAYEFAIQANIIMLFLDIVRSWHQNGIDIQNDTFIKDKDLVWINKAMTFIEDHYYENITAKETAKICLMSYNYFTTRFKQLLGRSFSCYLNYIRLRQAEYHLMSSDKSVTDIAYECGFSSTSYFISMFAKHKSVTPQNYRKRIKNTG